MKLITTNNRQQSKGFTLIEVLVALVVMTVGMLGIAGLYVESLRAGKTSVYRTKAVALAEDMAGRIRANSGVPENYKNKAEGVFHDCEAKVPDGCSQPEMAELDWFEWLAAVEQQLPAGAGARIEFEELGGTDLGQYHITVEWPEVSSKGLVSFTLNLIAHQ